MGLKTVVRRRIIRSNPELKRKLLDSNVRNINHSICTSGLKTNQSAQSTLYNEIIEIKQQP